MKFENQKITEAARIIKKGGVVLVPTRCLYGLATDAFNEDAVDRIFRMKERSYQKPILVLIHHKKEVKKLARHIPLIASRIMDTFWPGKVTILFEAKETLPAKLTAGTGKIGIRLCGHPVTAALAKTVGSPLTGTSANLAGHSGCSNPPDLESEIMDKLDLILDAGPLRGGVGSTVVDITGRSPKILREGAVSALDLRSLILNP